MIININCKTGMQLFLADNSVDAIVCDPPYELTSARPGGRSEATRGAVMGGFMGMQWDGTGIAFDVEMWAECLRVLKPGGHLLAFGGSRTAHRMVCAIEDAGFEVRDSIVWLYGSGMPKSHSVHKAILPVVESRYGKETKCDCLDCGNGRPVGHAAGRKTGGDVRIQRTAGGSSTSRVGHSVVQIDAGASANPVRDLRENHGAEGTLANTIENAVLLSGMRGVGAEAEGLGNTTLRTGMEESPCGNPSTGQNLQMLRENAGTEWVGAARPSLETVSIWGHEPSVESGSPVRQLPPSDRVTDRSSFTFDPSRSNPRQLVADDQCGWPTPVAHVCSWCGLPDREWLDGLTQLGTALKPAHEPICVARKPLIGTVASNILAHGTGAINIDGCRVPTNGEQPKGSGARESWRAMEGRDDLQEHGGNVTPAAGRWPANVITDGSDEVLSGFPDTAPSKAAARGIQQRHDVSSPETARPKDGTNTVRGHSDAGGSAARYFYCAKASTAERGAGNNHPTVKPIALMRYLVRLVTPPGGLVLDPFTGSGTTAVAAKLEGAQFMGFELSPEYAAIATARYEATNVDAAVNKGLLLPKFNQAQP